MVKSQNKLERFIMNIEDEDLYFVEKLARQNGITMSWIFRSILVALEKKFKKSFSENYEVKRPVKFKKAFRKATVCMYGDKSKWMSLSRIWKMELGPLIRFGLKLYQNEELELDFESTSTIKDIQFSKRGKKSNRKQGRSSNRCICLYQNKSNLYSKQEYWEKNPIKNKVLMDFGLSNRIYPLILE